MRLENKELGLAIEISEILIDKMCRAGLKHYPNEYGGLLVGEYSGDKQLLFINQILMPKSFKSSPISFERDSNGLKQRLEKFFRQDPPQIYVGEWHTHPNGLPIPSSTDLKAIIKIVADAQVNIDNPVMLIIGLTKMAMELAFYVYFNQKLYSYEKI